MMLHLNRTILAGRVMYDPEFDYTPTGTAVVNFTIASDRHWFERGTGNPRVTTMTIMCSAYGKNAETVNRYVKGGFNLLVAGRLESYGYDGNTSTRHVMVVEQVQLLPQDDGGSDAALHEQQKQRACSLANQKGQRQ